MTLDFRLRLANSSLLIELNGAWLLVDFARRRAVIVEFGRVDVDQLESQARY